MTRSAISVVIGMAAMVVLVSGLGDGARAGGGESFGRDEEALAGGTRFFGFVKDTKGNVIPDVKIVVEIKGRNASLVMRANADGHYHLPALGKDMTPDNVTITCSKEGYKMATGVVMASNPNPPDGIPAVEVDCILAR
jgi:hypothetical protein